MKVSHIALIKCSIKGANLQLLHRAVESLAKELGAQITNEIKDYYGNTVKVDLGIIHPDFHRGVGVVVEKGEVKLKGDFWGFQEQAQRLQNLLTKHYTAQAMAQALRSLGYQVQQQAAKDKIYVKAVNY
jgi:hypothetical protein